MKKLNNMILTCAVLCCSMNAYAGDVVLTTQKAIGEPFTIATDADISITLKWGNGTEEVFDSDGQPTTFTVKDAQLTLSTTNDITRLYMPENGITAINVSGINTTLKKLYCPNNALTTLDVRGCTKLTDIDVQDNQIETISFDVTMVGGLKGMIESLNCAGNKLQKFAFSSASTLKNFIVAGNQFTSIPTSSVLVSLFAQNNQLTTLALTSKGLKNLVLDNNQLTELNLASLTSLQDLWMANNAVEAIDLSGLSTLEAFVAPNNQLAGITWTKTSAANLYAALAYFDVSNNALNYTHFPTIDIAAHPINAVLAPQSAFAFSEGVDINTKVSFRDFRLNGWNQSITPVIKCYDAEGTELIEGTDYSIQSANLTILTPHEGMYIGISSNKYPGVELFSLPFDAKDPTGISTMNNAQSTMHNEVYDMQGRKVTNLDSRTSNPNLTKGIYIINGKKAVIK